MKKSAKVTLSVVAMVGLASCGRRRYDPCEQSYFDSMACQEAVRSGGYYWGGSWFPMTYHYPYPYYFDSYQTYVRRGGRVTTAPPGSYARPADGGKRFGTGGSSGAGASGSSSPASGVTRGGFGSTGSGHSSGE